MTLCQINQDKIKILRGPVSSVSSDTVSKILPNPGFVICFLKVPLAFLGSTAAAVQPNGLWNSQKTFCKTFFHNLPPQTVESLEDDSDSLKRTVLERVERD